MSSPDALPRDPQHYSNEHQSNEHQSNQDYSNEHQPNNAGVRQLRLVVRAEDFDAAVAFYRDVLGLPEQAAFQGDGEARVMILDAGRATLELANPAQVAMIDGIEAGGQPSAPLRVAFEVADSGTATRRLVQAGAELIAEPVRTPWNSLNSRLDAPAGLQLTLFQELDAQQPDQP